MKKLFLLLIVSLSLSAISDGQYSVLLNFNGTNGAAPYQCSLTLAGKTLYGVASGGGANGGGCIFSIDTNGNNYKDLYDFIFVTSPSGSLAISGKTLYGMTNTSGLHNVGYIFSIDTNGMGYKDIFDFYAYAVGAGPQGSPTLVGGKLYGMAIGGINSMGCIFSVDTTGNNYKDIFDFNGINGSYPDADLTFFNNRLYGTTLGGGTNDSGCIFSIDTDGSAYKKILDFNGTNGKNPSGNNVILSGDTVYGMTTLGGANNKGCIFSIDTTGNGYRKLLDFSGANGGGPEGSLTLLGSKLYGMTAYGGAGDSGLIFSIDTNGNSYKVLLYFNGVNGANPLGSLTIRGNNLYGMTWDGGANNEGVVFKIDTSAIAGIGNISTENEMLKVYPNPSNGIFQLEIKNEELGMNNRLEVYNILGEKVYTLTQPSPNGGGVSFTYSINLSAEPNGIYLYRVITETGELVGEGKVVIQR